MKKNYIKPCTTSITVMAHNLLQDSINMGGSKGTFNSSTMQQASRRGGDNSWDDEE